METKLIGITGQTGSGKSFIGSVLKKQAMPVINIDNMLNDMFNPGTNIHRKVIEIIGTEVLNIDGTINMVELTNIIANEKWVANLVDWVVEDEVEGVIDRIKSAFTYNDIEVGVLECTNLLNSKIKKYIFKTIFVQCDDSVRLDRMVMRGISYQIAKRIINNTFFINTNEVDYLINNSGNFIETEEQTLKIHHKILNTL